MALCCSGTSSFLQPVLPLGRGGDGDELRCGAAFLGGAARSYEGAAVGGGAAWLSLPVRRGRSSTISDGSRSPRSSPARLNSALPRYLDPPDARVAAAAHPRSGASPGSPTTAHRVLPSPNCASTPGSLLCTSCVLGSGQPHGSPP